ncbi:hypothetical protein NG797_00660 [Laspinema sp. D5]|nr:hypothetical protein [Laspinema sp. D3d]
MYFRRVGCCSTRSPPTTCNQFQFSSRCQTQSNPDWQPPVNAAFVKDGVVQVERRFSLIETLCDRIRRRNSPVDSTRCNSPQAPKHNLTPPHDGGDGHR